LYRHSSRIPPLRLTARARLFAVWQIKAPSSHTVTEARRQQAPEEANNQQAPREKLKKHHPKSPVQHFFLSSGERLPSISSYMTFIPSDWSRRYVMTTQTTVRSNDLIEQLYI
jgi:hypothetical protein